MKERGNMENTNLTLIEPIIKKYYRSFLLKTYGKENDDHDFLMDVFNISPELKRENRQYWARELGMVWQKIVYNLAENNCDDFKPPLKCNKDKPCSMIIGKDAVDTKYRMGSGDSGTIKKFRQYGEFLSNKGYRPVLLIVRSDNLPNAIKSCDKAGWKIFCADAAVNYLLEKTGVDIRVLLASLGEQYFIDKEAILNS